MRKSSVLVSRLFTSLFLVLYIFVQPLLAIETLIPQEDSADTPAAALQEESLPLDTEESILDEGISDPAEIIYEEVIPTEEVAKEEVQEEQTSTPIPLWNTSNASSTTSLPVEIGQTYIYPLDTAVTVKFTQLPEISSTLTISTISLTDGEIKAVGATSSTAYDISTDMVDGTFKYDLTLPSQGNVETNVVYAENRIGLLSGGTLVQNQITEKDDILTIDNLEHFTVFVVTTDTPPLSDSTTPTCVNAGATSNSDCFNDIQSAINAASNGDTVNVKAGVYEISNTININKEINLVGPSSGIAKIVQTSNPAIPAFSISSSNVTLDNFEITNEQYFPENHLEVTNALISIPNNANISNVTILNNNIYSNYAPGTLQKDMYTRGITIGDNATTSISVIGNTISNVRNGIVIRTNNTSVTSDNTIFNTKGGIMHYTSSFVDSGNRITLGNTWTDIHNEWDIVWNSATYGFPNYQESVINTSIANNDAYVLDLRREISTVVSSLTENRSPVFVTSTGLDKVHQSSGNPAEPFATLQYAIDTVTPGGTIYLLSNLDISSQITIDKPLTIEGNNHTIFSQFTKTDNSNNSGIGIHSDNVTLKNVIIDGTNGTTLHGINIYKVTNIILDHVTSSNNDNAGMVVNGSIVTVKDITTSGNGWGGINVDLGGGVTTEAKLTVQGTSNHSELFQIWIDDYRELASVVDVENQYDYTDFGYTRVYHLKIATPELLGWNIKNSPTDTPSTPRPNTELSCNSFTNINGASSHWTDVSNGDSNIKYQRQYRYNLGSAWTNWAGNEIYTNPYTDFRVFGSASGNDGIYDTHVRAFYDINSNNVLDGNELYSEWSNGCQITFDKTPPSKPVITNSPNNSFTNVNAITIRWTGGDDQGTNNSGIKGYIFRYIFTPANGGADTLWTTNLVSVGNPMVRSGSYGHGEGRYVMYVQTVDNVGNVGPESDPFTITYDKTNPTTPTNLYFRDLDNNQDIQCNGYSNTKHVSEYWDASVDVNLDHYEYSSYNAPNGVAGLVSYPLNTNFYDTGWWLIPSEGTYGFQVRAVDKAGNKSAWALSNSTGIENSCKINIDWTKPNVDFQFNVNDHNFKAVFSENVNRVDAENPANYFLSNWPTAGGSGNLVGDASISYDSSSNTALITFTNSGWYISPEQQWGVQDVRDLAGNILTVTPYTEYSTPMLAPETTVSGIDTAWHSTNVTVNLLCTDINGSGCYKTHYSLDGGTTYAVGNAVIVSSEGENTIHFYSEDMAGNIETIKASDYVKIDKSDPDLTISNPSATLPIAGMFTMNGIASDSLSGIRKVTLNFGAGITQDAILGASSWSLDVNDGVFNLLNGVYDVTVTAEDNSGNTTSAILNGLTIDNEKPTASTLGALTFTVGSTTPRIITLTDNHELEEICYSFGSSYSCSPISGVLYSWDVSSLINTLGVGSTVFSYYVKDEAGNQSDAELLTEGDLPYSSAITVQLATLLQQVLGTNTTNNNRLFTRSIITEEEPTVDTEEEEELLTEPLLTDENDPEVLAATDQQENDEKTFPWWGYLLIAAILSFIIFILWKRRKDEKEQGYQF